MNNALRLYIGRICHVYLDDIIIWSQSLKEHHANVEMILLALHAANLFVSDKKTDLFLLKVDFLSHHISQCGIEPDGKKVEKILNWPIPHSAGHVRSFLGLVCYLAAFLPNLAEHTRILNPLTSKEAEGSWPGWSLDHQMAFNHIKTLVCSHECLTSIDHDALDSNRIFVSCDASDFHTGAMLSFGPDLESARPVAFESAPLTGAELNYPVHKKELLAIVRALEKWRVNLLDVPFTVYTDHRTLENFNCQKNLSHHQSRWQEFLGQYNFSIKYIKGEENIVADALSRVNVVDPATCASVAAIHDITHAVRDCPDASPPIAACQAGTLCVVTDPAWLDAIRSGYDLDSWCQCLRNNVGSLGITERNGLLFMGDRLAIPHVANVHEGLFRCAHDAMGHFSFDKSYAFLRDAYYWPHM